MMVDMGTYIVKMTIGRAGIYDVVFCIRDQRDMSKNDT